jgi:hypothetical protein
MATRISESKDLAARCRKAGLKVTVIRDGWKVYDPQNQPHVIHRTYSDGQWSLKLITKEIEEAGLLEAEKIQMEEKAEARKAAARELRAKEARALEEAQQRADRNNALVVKAAGPYMVEPEDVGYDWFATPHPAPWMRIVWMYPELADKILKNHNSDNRPVNDKQVEHYKNVILSGQWKFTHQGGAMDTRAVLQDIQHRFFAIVAAGEVDPDVRVPVAFWVGMPVENFAAIDENLLRTAAHLFGKAGEKYVANLQAVMRLVIAFRTGGESARRVLREKITNQTYLDEFGSDADHIRECVAFGVNGARKLRGCTATNLATAAYLIRSANGPDNQYVEAFFAGLVTGTKAWSNIVLPGDDPRAVLREKFMEMKDNPKSRKPAIDIVAMIIKSWNNIVMERSPRTLNHDPRAAMPQILICHVNQGVAPRQLSDEINDEAAA